MKPACATADPKPGLVKMLHTRPSRRKPLYMPGCRPQTLRRTTAHRPQRRSRHRPEQLPQNLRHTAIRRNCAWIEARLQQPKVGHRSGQIPAFVGTSARVTTPQRGLGTARYGRACSVTSRGRGSETGRKPVALSALPPGDAPARRPISPGYLRFCPSHAGCRTDGSPDNGPLTIRIRCGPGRRLCVHALAPASSDRRSKRLAAVPAVQEDGAPTHHPVPKPSVVRELTDANDSSVPAARTRDTTQNHS